MQQEAIRQRSPAPTGQSLLDRHSSVAARTMPDLSCSPPPSEGSHGHPSAREETAPDLSWSPIEQSSPNAWNSMEGATTNERQQCSEAATLARHKQPDSSATQLRLERSLSCSVHQHGAQLGDPSTCAPSGAADDTELLRRRRRSTGLHSQRSLRPFPRTDRNHVAGVERIQARWVYADGHQPSHGRARRQPAVCAESEFDIRANAARLEDCAGTSGTLTQPEAEFILQVLRGHFLFARLPMVQLLRVCRHMQRIELPTGQRLVTQGEPNARHFFIVASGALEVQVSRLGSTNDVVDDEADGCEGRHHAFEVVARLRPSATLGEMALLSDSTRSASVMATEPSSVFSLTRAAYQLTLIEGTDTLADDGTTNDSAESSLRCASQIVSAIVFPAPPYASPHLPNRLIRL